MKVDDQKNNMCYVYGDAVLRARYGGAWPGHTDLEKRRFNLG